MGETPVGDDELRLEVEMGGTNRLRWRGRRGGKWKVVNSLLLGGPLLPWPTSLVHARNSGDGKEFAARRVTSLSPGEQGIILLIRAKVSRPPLVLLDEVWSGMNECMISTVWRRLTEGGGVGGTGSSCDYPLG